MKNLLWKSNENVYRFYTYRNEDAEMNARNEEMNTIQNRVHKLKD